MGSGNRFKFGRLEGFGIGLYVSRFPFALTLTVNLFFWYVSLGLGKPYDAI